MSECPECKRWRRLATTYRELLNARIYKQGQLAMRLRAEIAVMEADLDASEFEKPNELGKGIV